MQITKEDFVSLQTSTPPILSIESLEVEFTQSGGLFRRGGGGEKIKAVDKVSFEIRKGETFGLVGESGCGKSTLARAILGLAPIKSGKIHFDGRDISTIKGKDLLQYRRSVQVIFQDPYSSLDPRQRILDSVTEPLKFHGLSKEDSLKRARDMLDDVGIRPEQFSLFPHQFSGGQRQRICTARSLALHPRLLILDEPTSALDVSIQAQILILLKSLQSKFDLTYLFISHNLSVVRMMSDRVASMFKGKVVECGNRDQIFAHSAHPYTQRLISAIPEPIPSATRRNDGRVATPEMLKVSANQTSHPHRGVSASHCVYVQACPYAFEKCLVDEPPMQQIEPTHTLSCHLYPDIINNEIRTSMENVLNRNRIVADSKREKV